MDPRHDDDGGLWKPPPGASAHNDDVLEASPTPVLAVEPRPDQIPGGGSGALSLAIPTPEVIPSQALDEEITAVVGGASDAPAGGHQEEEGTAAAAAVAAARIQTTVAMNDTFVPMINDVKAMLQTGRFEGQQVIYRTKRQKLNLLHGVIRGAAYFCSCGDCDHNGKALSARAFEHHALKNGKETHNPNDHIILCSSNISMFEACRKLKETRNETILEATFDSIIEGHHKAVPKQNVEASVVNTSADNSNNLVDIVRNLEKRVESTEKRMENLQSHVDTIEKNIDFFCKEMVRYQELFQDLSKVLGRFVDDM